MRWKTRLQTGTIFWDVKPMSDVRDLAKASQ